MLNKILMTSAAVAALWLSSSLAVGQSGRSESGGSAQQSQAAPGGASGAEKSTGQAPGLEKRGAEPSGAGKGSERAQERRTGETQPTTGGAARSGEKAEPTPKSKGAADSKSSQQNETQGSGTSDTQRSGSSDTQRGTASDTKTGTDTRSGSASSATDTKSGAANVNVTSEQQTRIRSVVQKVNVREVNNVNVSISVGTALPASVELVAIPTEIVEIVPQFRGYRVIKIGGRIIIVEPSSRKIVYIINV